MGKYRFEGYEGVHEGATPEEAWANLQANLQPEESSFGNSVKRGVGLGVRNTAFAPAKAATSLADLVAGGVNAFLNTARPLGAQPKEFLPAGNREYLEGRLDEFLPTPTGITERAADFAGEAAFTGVPLGAAVGSAKALPGIVAPATKVGSTQPVARTMTSAQRNLVKGKLPADATASSVVSGGERQIAAGSLGDEIASAVATRPVMTTLSEAGGGAGASAGLDTAAEYGDDLPLAAKMGLLLGGGVAGSMAPQMVASRASRASGLLKRVVDPITGNVNAETAAERVLGGQGRRAAQALQGRADDPAAAARAALDAPEGVPPAQATGDPELMALQNRVLTDDVQRADQVQKGLDLAEARVLDDLTGDLPEGVSRQQWQQQVIQRSAPEGTTIAIGEPDEMLSKANDAFTKAYNVVRGQELADVDFMPLIADAVTDPNVLTDAATRQGILRWVQARYDTILRRPGTLTSDDLLDLRRDVRQQQRRFEKAGQTNPDAAAQADLLDVVDDVTTSVLEAQLPEDVARHLKATDRRYSDFKATERAMWASGERGLTPEALRSSLRFRMSQGRFARGDTGDLGQLAERGKDVTTLFPSSTTNTDDQIRRAFRTMDEPTAQAARADITRHLITKARKSEEGIPRLMGPAFRYRIEQNVSRLRAAGFTDDDIGRLNQVAQRLTTIQRKTSASTEHLVDDSLGFLSRLVAGAVGVKGTQKLSQFLRGGGTTSLMMGGIVRSGAQQTLRDLGVSGAEKLISDAVTDPELFAALLTRSTAPAIQQVRANRIMNAWLLQNENVFDEPEE